MSGRFLIFLLLLLFLAACGDSGPLSADEAREHAAMALMGKPRFDSNPPSTVSYDGTNYTVEFTFPTPEGIGGGSYVSRVVFNGDTKEIEELEARIPGGDQGVAPRAAPAYRPTPLSEEVDAVGELQKRLQTQ